MKVYDNGKYRIDIEAGCDYNYITFVKCDGFMQEVGRSWNLSKKVTEPFSPNEIRKIKAEIHGIKYAKRFR